MILYITVFVLHSIMLYISALHIAMLYMCAVIHTATL